MGYQIYVEKIFTSNMKKSGKDNSPKVLTFKLPKAPIHIQNMVKDINSEIIEKFNDKLHLNEYDVIREDKKLVKDVIKAIEASLTGGSNDKNMYRDHMITRDSKGNYKGYIQATGWPQVISCQDNEYWPLDDEEETKGKCKDYTKKVDTLTDLLHDIDKDIQSTFGGKYPGFKLELSGDGDGDLSWEITFDGDLAMRVWDEISSKTFPESVMIIEDGSVEEFIGGNRTKYPDSITKIEESVQTQEREVITESSKEIKAKFSDLPQTLQRDLNAIHKLYVEEFEKLKDKQEYFNRTNRAPKQIETFTSSPKSRDKEGMVTLSKDGDKYECMIQLTGHFKNDKNGPLTQQILHRLVKGTYKAVKPVAQKKYGIRLDYEGDKEPFEGFDAYPSNEVAKEIFYKLSKSVNESTTPEEPEYNTDMSEAQAKRTIGTLSSTILEDKKKKVTQYTANIYANIITKNLLPVWAKEFKRFKITLTDDRHPVVEFITPAMTQEFVSKFINGRVSLRNHLTKSSEIRMKISSKVFQSMEHRDDAYHFFKNAIIYYSTKVNKYGSQLMVEVNRLGHNMKHLVATSKLSGLVTYPMTLLFVFNDVKMNDRNAFTLSKDDIGSVNRFVRNIATRYAAPEREKKQIVDDLKDMVKTLKEYCEPSDTLNGLTSFPEAVESLFNGGFTKDIGESSGQFIFEQVDREYKPVSSVKPLYEKFGVKRLKKIPRDLIVYITIETESIKDANDKHMIAAYTTGKIEIVEWYIELLEVGSKKYIVPHTKQYLESIRTQLLACLKKIMEFKVVPLSQRPLIDIVYPKGYEG